MTDELTIFNGILAAISEEYHIDEAEMCDLIAQDELNWRQLVDVQGWVKYLPPEVVQAWPELTNLGRASLVLVAMRAEQAVSHYMTANYRV